jgi:hypothetical protein
MGYQQVSGVAHDSNIGHRLKSMLLQTKVYAASDCEDLTCKELLTSSL